MHLRRLLYLRCLYNACEPFQDSHSTLWKLYCQSPKLVQRMTTACSHCTGLLHRWQWNVSTEKIMSLIHSFVKRTLIVIAILTLNLCLISWLWKNGPSDLKSWLWLPQEVWFSTSICLWSEKNGLWFRMDRKCCIYARKLPEDQVFAINYVFIVRLYRIRFIAVVNDSLQTMASWQCDVRSRIIANFSLQNKLFWICLRNYNFSYKTWEIGNKNMLAVD